MPFSQPQPVRAMPMRYKDEAIANVQYLDMQQGLSFSFVYAMLEDSRGDIWFGMDGTGLTKYNAVEFIHYTTKNGLISNTINRIIESSKGELWIATTEGISVFDGKNFNNIDLFPGLKDKSIFALTEDKRGNIWIGSMHGLVKYDGKKFTFYTTKEGMPGNDVKSCIVDYKGKLWIGTSTGLALFDGEVFTHFTQKDGLPNNYVFALLQDSKHNIWISNGYGITKKRGLTMYDGKSFTSYDTENGISSNHIWSMMEDRSGNIWLGTSLGGLNKFDGKNFTHYTLAEGITNNKVRQIIQDKAGNIWFATDGGGVNKLNTESFSTLPHNEVITNNRVRPIINDNNGNTWFGTEGAGIGKYDATAAAGFNTGFEYYAWDNFFDYNGQRSLYADRQGNIWMGTTSNGLFKIDGNDVWHYTVKEGLSSMSIFSILQDKGGNLWLGTQENGITCISGKTITHFTEEQGLLANTIFAMMEDSRKNLWFCTKGGGIIKYDGANSTVYSEKEGLFSIKITSILEDKDGNIWLGTQGAGVCRFDGKQFTYFSEKQGLTNNNVWSLIKDSLGRIWAGTDNGLNCFLWADKRLVIYNYGLQDGLKALDFNFNGACIDKNNFMWWSTGKNILIKNLDNTISNNQQSQAKLDYIEINERYFDFRNLPDSMKKKIMFGTLMPFSNCPQNLTLTYDQDFLRFHFYATNWLSPDKIKYSYRMKGLNETWSSPSSSTIADYRNLRYGDYTFEVMYIGPSQVWSKPTAYHFTILPAWWQSWWFKTLMVIAGLVTLFFIALFIYNYQLRKQKTALEKQLAVQYERQRISSEMHDDIGAGLSGIRLLTELMKKKVKDEQTVEDVEKIYQSLGEISAKMKEVIWSLKTDNDTLAGLLYYLQTQARAWLEHFPCQLQIIAPHSIPQIKINGETRRNIFLIVKEAVHNIIKTPGADKVVIEMRCNSEITVVDYFWIIAKAYTRKN
ncbi:MAG: two-component regulator propeller domain-containing protein [Ferruginibacter sp.]